MTFFAQLPLQSPLLTINTNELLSKYIKKLTIDCCIEFFSVYSVNVEQDLQLIPIEKIIATSYTCLTPQLNQLKI